MRSMIGVTLALAVLAVLVLGAMAARMRAVVRTLPGIGPGDVPLSEDETVSVIIPARNEEAIVGATVRAVLESSSSNRLEVLVVDDQSTDGTAGKVREIQARDARLRLISGGPRPEGEIILGKNWACWQGAQAAKGRILLFADADFTMKAGCIESAVALLRAQNGGLLGLMPEKELSLWCEWFVEPQLTILHLVGPWLAETPDPRKSRAFTPGWFMLFDRTTYEKIGGHWAVRGKVLEDLALGERVKAAGDKVVFALAPRAARLHLYDSSAEMLEGYTKNFFCGAGHSVPAALMSTGLLLLIYCVPWLGCLMALATWGTEGWAWLLLLAFSVAGVSLQFLLRWRLRSAMGIGLRAFWAVPIGGVLLAGISLQSMVRHLRGGITWKGIPISDH